MDSMKVISCLHFVFSIMSAKIIKYPDSKGYLFVRCYLPDGINKRFGFESHKITPNEIVSWDESLSLDCIATMQFMDLIFKETFVFELRWSSSTIPSFKTIIGCNGILGGSQLLGSAKVPVRSIFKSPNMESERWVMMGSKKGAVKSPSIHQNMKIQTSPKVVVMNEKKVKDVGKLKSMCDEGVGAPMVTVVKYHAQIVKLLP